MDAKHSITTAKDVPPAIQALDNALKEQFQVYKARMTELEEKFQADLQVWRNDQIWRETVAFGAGGFFGIGALVICQELFRGR